MIHLNGLLVDADPQQSDHTHFVASSDAAEVSIFSMTYLNGTVSSGAIAGRWTPPGPSPTNSVLLWPKAFRYFTEEARKVTPAS